MLPNAAWLCWIIPMIGAALIPLFAKIHPKVRDVLAVLFPAAAAVFAVSMIPDILSGFTILSQPEILIGESPIPWDITQTITIQGVSIPVTLRWISLLPYDAKALWIPWLPVQPPIEFWQAPYAFMIPRGIYAGVLVDPLSVFMACVVTCIGFLIMVFSLGYMHGDPDLTRYWFFMNFFIGGMTMLVIADNLLQLFIGWEIVGLCSWALIGFWHKKEEPCTVPKDTPEYRPTEGEYNALCGMKAFITTKIGDIALLIAIAVIFFFSGTFNLVQLQQNAAINFAAGNIGWVTDLAVRGLLPTVALLLFGGPVAKSAQFPLHEWLPEAMAGPTTVSALIHAATMVKAGVYLVARMLPIFYGSQQILLEAALEPAKYSSTLVLTSGQWIFLYTATQYGLSTFFNTVASIGVFTAFLAATMGVVSRELKKVLAYSTISQIGYMMLALGVVGTSMMSVIGFAAGTFHLMAHAIFKALLFLCAGAVLHAVETKDMFEMGGLKQKMPITYACMVVGGLSLAGFPGFAGFFSKEAIFGATLKANQLAMYVLAAVVVAITTFYTFRMIGLVFHGEPSSHVKKIEEEHGPVKEAPPVMWVPLVILAAATLAAGWLEPLFRQFFLGPIGVYLFEAEYVHPVLLGGLSFSEYPHFVISQVLTHEQVVLLEVYEYLHLTTYSGWFSELAGAWMSIVVSLGLFAVGFVPAWHYYVARRGDPSKITSNKVGGAIWRFLWNRWYINQIYYLVFVDGFLKLASAMYSYVERGLDRLNYVAAAVTVKLSDSFRKTQTGIAYVNIMYLLLGVLVFMFLLLVFW
ncbi:MAG: proton-conducting transporter membrane subunit [Candidatus Jordarchaeales archaeon]